MYAPYTILKTYFQNSRNRDEKRMNMSLIIILKKEMYIFL